MTSNQQLLTYEDVANRWGLSISTLYMLVRNKSIPHIRLSKRLVRFEENAVSTWISENTIGAQDDE